ncbi:MAG: CDGSH iron-sulfur domain-containing protein [Pirellulales bacterium]
MSEVRIRMRPNGPFVIEGPITLVDSEGNTFTLTSDKPSIALCRCGESANRPFCDGAHKSCGFLSDERATPTE